VAQLLAKARWISDIGGARDLTGILSRGDYAKRNIVESVLAGIGRPERRSEPTPGPPKQ